MTGPDPASARPEDRSPLLSVEHLSVHFAGRGGLFHRRAGRIHAVSDVTFHIMPGETFGLVGESGSGKTTVGRAVLRLIPASRGIVRFDGLATASTTRRAMRNVRRRMQIVFQDPGGSLDPRMRVGPVVAEPLRVHRICRGKQLRNRVVELLERCGLPASAAERFPHEFSGGQRQRIAIARALALEPRLIVCDEPTSALDVSIQSQILNLLRDLQKNLGLSYLFISHDMAVVNHMCDRIAVMKDGRIVEQGDRESIIRSPQHDYTRALLAAVPVADPRH
jgi:ABC-type glutathione transport system ATPase component